MNRARHSVFVLRYKTWVNHFNADPSILNKPFVLNGTARTLIGIMPPRFGWGDADVWIPEKPSHADTTPQPLDSTASGLC